ncbi:MAG TPA: rhodanese-like domain-containing protein [Vicinamibacterales bacterium]|nr:rhodanese-like domain-containing protein [Vicinamibacterales bacterium]
MALAAFVCSGAGRAPQPAASPQMLPPVDSPELRISFDEFKRLYDRGAVLVVDVRSREAYDEGHIPGALSVPLDDLEAQIDRLARDKRAIVTYCS